MVKHTEDEIDRVFILFHEDRRSDTPRPLASWIADNPGLADSLVQWATETPSLEVAELLSASPQMEQRSLELGRRVLDRLKPGERTGQSLSSLNDAARSVGSKPRDLAAAMGLGMAVFAKLNRRLIDAATIPARLTERLAEELRVPADAIRAYLEQRPTLAAGAAYKAEDAPAVERTETFNEAVAGSPDMTDDQKRAWL